MTGKMAGEEISTPFGVVVVRKAVRRGAEKQLRRMFIMCDKANDVNLIGWGR
jgi:hypothetical protein